MTNACSDEDVLSHSDDGSEQCFNCFLKAAGDNNTRLADLQSSLSVSVAQSI